MGADYSDLPAFAFPVLTWGPNVATGEPSGHGIGIFYQPQDVVMLAWPEGNRRLGRTFVDSDGRCWEIVAERVTRTVPVFLMKLVSLSLYKAEYRMRYEFVERPPMTVEAVREFLIAALTADRALYRGREGREYRKQVETARQMSDFFTPRVSLEQDAINGLVPVSLPKQWLTWKGRCSRWAFAAAWAMIGAFWLRIWLDPNAPEPRSMPVMLATVATGFVGLSLVVRRLHDLRRTGWWGAYWGLWTMICAWIHDTDKDGAAAVVAGWLWWTVTACMVVCLSILPGTRGPNLYGFGRGTFRKQPPNAVPGEP